MYPLVADLLAETPAERARAVRLINSTVSYIVQNGYYLIDVTGLPTTYGHFISHFSLLRAPIVVQVQCSPYCVVGGVAGHRKR